MENEVGTYECIKGHIFTATEGRFSPFESRPCQICKCAAKLIRVDSKAQTAPSTVDVAWIDDNNGMGPQKLSNSIRCF